MDDSIFQVAQLLFTNGLRILQIRIPWLGMSFLQLFLGILVVNVAIFIVRDIFFDGISVDNGGNNNRVRIADDRREDTK